VDKYQNLARELNRLREVNTEISPIVQQSQFRRRIETAQQSSARRRP